MWATFGRWRLESTRKGLSDVVITINNNKHAYAGATDSFTHLSVNPIGIILTDRGILAQSN
jgi:hypothetical protein